MEIVVSSGYETVFRMMKHSMWLAKSEFDCCGRGRDDLSSWAPL